MEKLLQFFEYSHLPLNLQEVSKQFWTLAHRLELDLPDNPERHEMFRKLLETKDCAVRTALYKTEFP